MGVRELEVASACANKEGEQCAMMYTFTAVETKADNTTNNLGREKSERHDLEMGVFARIWVDTFDSAVRNM